MTQILTLISFLFLFHFISDFVLQPDKIAKTKSKKISSLLIHIAIYGSSFFVMSLVTSLFFKGVLNLPIVTLVVYCLVNSWLHLMVDFVTSKVTSYLWKEGRVHDFFVVIGIDQLLHNLCLIWTLVIFLKLF